MKHFIVLRNFIYNSLALHLSLNDSDNEANADYLEHLYVLRLTLLWLDIIWWHNIKTQFPDLQYLISLFYLIKKLK